MTAVATMLAMLSAIAIAKAQDSMHGLELSMDQKEYLRSIQGDWELDKIIVKSHEFDLAVAFNAITVSESGITYRNSSGELNNIRTSYLSVDHEENRIDLALQVNDEMYRQSACINDDRLWIINRYGCTELPRTLHPIEGNICFIFKRRQAKQFDDGNNCWMPTGERSM